MDKEIKFMENKDIVDEKKQYRKEIFVEIFKTIGIVLFIASMLVMIYKFVSEFKDTLVMIAVSKNEVVETSKYLIVSVKYNEQVEGEYRSFILGKGEVSEISYYVVYQVLEDGGKKLVKLETDDTIIYDNLNDSDEPYVEYDKNKYDEILAIRLYVPKGTITQDYDLSVE